MVDISGFIPDDDHPDISDAFQKTVGEAGNMVRFRAENPEWAYVDDGIVKGTLAYQLAVLGYRIEETSWLVRWHFRRDLKRIQRIYSTAVELLPADVEGPEMEKAYNFFEARARKWSDETG